MLAGLVLAVLCMVAASSQAASTPTGVSFCVKKRDPRKGTIRVVDASTACRSSERAVVLASGDSVEALEALVGKVGEKGPLGEKGTEGKQGSEGKQGPEGDKGPTGDKGPQGDQGLEGKEGPEGKQGPEGKEGKEGPQGKQGPEGPQGPSGEAAKGEIRGGGGDSTVEDGMGNRFFGPSIDFFSSTETAIQEVLPSGGKVSNLRVYLTGAPGPSNKYTFIVRRDPAGSAAVSTSLSCTASGNGVGSSSCESNDSAEFEAGDAISIQATESGSPTTRSFFFRLDYQP